MALPPRADAKRPTLAVVAQAAGVSTATASKVFNDRPDVAPETRRRVAEAIRTLGYEPTTAQRPAGGNPVVVVLFDTLVNMYSAQVLRGVLGAARELGVDVVVQVLHDGHWPERPLSPVWFGSVAQKGWKGVLVVTTEVTAAHNRAARTVGLPLVAIDPPNALDDSVVSVGSTNYNGGVQATAHLTGLGHRRIGVAGGPARSPVAGERLHGYRSALETAGITFDPDLVRRGKFEYTAGIEMSLALLGRPDRPTAIIAGSDATALGVIEGARRLGIRIPEELSVIGFDDTPAATSSAPPLTTIRQPMTELGRVALRSVLLQAAGGEPPSHHVQLATSLVIRGSTAPPCDS